MNHLMDRLSSLTSLRATISGGARFCANVSGGARFCTTVSGGARSRANVSGGARFCTTVSGDAKFCVSTVVALLVVFVGSLHAQNAPPAPPQSEKIVITNATVHIGNGEVMENAEVRFVDGLIERVGKPNRQPLSDYRQIDGTGKHVFPGLIALNTTLGLIEIGAVRATNDRREVGKFNANVRSLIAFNTDSQVLPTVRSRGVMMVESVPQGGVISGRSCLMHLDGWNYEDAVISTEAGMHLRWPSRRNYNWREGRWEADENYPAEIRELMHFMEQARAYCATDRDDTELMYQAMCPVLAGVTKLFVHAETAQDILAALELRNDFPALDIAIVGGAESYLITDELKAAEVSVVLGSTQALPRREDDPIDLPFRLPAMLAEAGVPFALNHGSGWGGWQQRNLPFQAGQAIGYGLDREEALRALTLTPAEILGLQDDIGSLETGKSATLIVVDGDLFDSRNSHVIHAFIDGREINLDNKQEFLARKFRSKYER
ncbi:MAG: amidohydrolase family protein [Bacteroidota bacterium]